MLFSYHVKALDMQQVLTRSGLNLVPAQRTTARLFQCHARLPDQTERVFAITMRRVLCYAADANPGQTIISEPLKYREPARLFSGRLLLGGG